MSTEVHNEEAAGTEPDKVNTGALGTLVVVGLFAMITICSAVTALVGRDVEVAQAEKDADANDGVVALKAQQNRELNAPASYINRAKGLISLPIETAKQLVVAELQRDPASATPPQPADTTASAAAVPVASGSAPSAAADSPKKPEEAAKSADDKKTAGAKPEPLKEKTSPAKPTPTSPPLSPATGSSVKQPPARLKN